MLASRCLSLVIWYFYCTFYFCSWLRFVSLSKHKGGTGPSEKNASTQRKQTRPVLGVVRVVGGKSSSQTVIVARGGGGLSWGRKVMAVWVFWGARRVTVVSVMCSAKDLPSSLLFFVARPARRGLIRYIAVSKYLAGVPLCQGSANTR